MENNIKQKFDKVFIKKKANKWQLVYTNDNNEIYNEDAVFQIYQVAKRHLQTKRTWLLKNYFCLFNKTTFIEYISPYNSRVEKCVAHPRNAMFVSKESFS